MTTAGRHAETAGPVAVGRPEIASRSDRASTCRRDRGRGEGSGSAPYAADLRPHGAFPATHLLRRPDADDLGLGVVADLEVGDAFAQHIDRAAGQDQLPALEVRRVPPLWSPRPGLDLDRPPVLAGLGRRSRLIGPRPPPPASGLLRPRASLGGGKLALSKQGAVAGMSPASGSLLRRTYGTATDGATVGPSRLGPHCQGAPGSARPGAFAVTLPFDLRA